MSATELSEKERCGCMITLGIFAVIVDAFVCINTKEITIVECVLLPIVIVGIVYWVYKYSRLSNEKTTSSRK